MKVDPGFPIAIMVIVWFPSQDGFEIYEVIFKKNTLVIDPTVQLLQQQKLQV